MFKYNKPVSASSTIFYITEQLTLTATSNTVTVYNTNTLSILFVFNVSKTVKCCYLYESIVYVGCEDFLYAFIRDECVGMCEVNGNVEQILRIENELYVLTQNNEIEVKEILNVQKDTLNHSCTIKPSFTVNTLFGKSELLIGSGEGFLYEKNQQQPIFNTHSSVLCMEQSPFIGLIALGLSNNTIVLLNMMNKEVCQKYFIGNMPVYLSFSSDGQVLLVTDNCGTVWVLCVEDGRILRVIEGDAHQAKFLSGQNVLVCGNGYMKTCELGVGFRLGLLKKREWMTNVSHMGFCGRRMLVLMGEKEAECVSVYKEEQSYKYSKLNTPNTLKNLSTNDHSVIAISDTHAYSLRNKRSFVLLQTSDPFTAACVSDSGSLAALGTKGGWIILLNNESGFIHNQFSLKETIYQIFGDSEKQKSILGLSLCILSDTLYVLTTSCFITFNLKSKLKSYNKINGITQFKRQDNLILLKGVNEILVCEEEELRICRKFVVDGKVCDFDMLNGWIAVSYEKENIKRHMLSVFDLVTGSSLYSMEIPPTSSLLFSPDLVFLVFNTHMNTLLYYNNLLFKEVTENIKYAIPEDTENYETKSFTSLQNIINNIDSSFEDTLTPIYDLLTSESLNYDEITSLFDSYVGKWKEIENVCYSTLGYLEQI